jgi:predicted MPP superfamily phosphohydrolase
MILISAFMFGVIGLCVLSAKVIALGLTFSPSATNKALVVGIILPVLFILGMVFTRSGAVPFVAYITSFLGAISFYVIVSSMLTGILIGISMLITKQILPSFVTVTLLFLGVLSGIMGIIQTTFLVVREYTVINPALPNSWNGITAVLVSDTHYGTLIGEKSATRVVKKIQSLSPDIVLHAGDLFDGQKIDGDKALAPWKALTATTPVVYASGNHEAYGDYATFIKNAKDAGFTVVHEKPFVYNDVTIAGIPYINKNETVQAMTILNNQIKEEDNQTLLINHHPAFIQDVASRNVFLMVSGHTHRGQFWPIRYITRAMYGKYYYGKQQYENLTTITTAGTGFSGIPQRFLTTPEIVKITFRK